MLKFLFKKNKINNVNDENSDDYFFEQLRKNEFGRLDKLNQTYLDYTGGNLYPQSLLNKHFAYLQNSVLGNPHSSNPTSLLSTQYVNEAREKVLQFFNATNDYYCIFTANASAALHIVGECYPFTPQSCFLLTADNHNSVNGIREYCTNKKGEFAYLPMNVEDLFINETVLENALTSYENCDNKLFAFPAQSNVSGVKHNLDWIEKAQSLGWDVLLDAAAFVPTSTLDLNTIKPDFVSISFYKIFGYPTGMGCLLVRKSKFEKLQKPWFAGGTVSYVGVNFSKHYLINNHERFENGTVNYLDIPAITNGLNFIENIGMERINNRVKYLIDFLFTILPNIIHANNAAVVKIYGPLNTVQKGGTIIFTILKKNGEMADISKIEKLANLQNISLRTGCFCNPGIDEINNDITADELSTFFTSNTDNTFQYKTEFLGKMRGAIRISVGIATIKKDLIKLIDFIDSFKE